MSQTTIGASTVIQGVVTVQGDSGTATGTTINIVGSGNITVTGDNASTLTIADSGSYVTSVSGTSNRITSTGGATPAIDISASYVGQNSITTLGTITTGTWNATAVATAYGGTGLTSPGSSGNVLTSNGTIWTSAAPSSGSGGYIFQMSTSIGDPADATTYYLAEAVAITGFTTAVNRSKLFIPKTGTITVCLGACAVTGTLGSAGSSTFAIRLNDTTSTTVTSSLAMTSATNTFSNNALSISVTEGDYISFIVTTPTWVTNPTTVTFTVTAYIEIA